MGKYKIGDKVLIRKGLKPDEHYGEDYVLYINKMYIEGPVTIKSLSCFNNSYYILECPEHWLYAEEMLMPFESESPVVELNRTDLSVKAASRLDNVLTDVLGIDDRASVSQVSHVPYKSIDREAEKTEEEETSYLDYLEKNAPTLQLHIKSKQKVQLNFK